MIYNRIRKYFCFVTYNFQTMKLFTKENGTAFIVTLAAVMVGLAVHQRFVAPRIKK